MNQRFNIKHYNGELNCNFQFTGKGAMFTWTVEWPVDLTLTTLSGFKMWVFFKIPSHGSRLTVPELLFDLILFVNREMAMLSLNPHSAYKEKLQGLEIRQNRSAGRLVSSRSLVLQNISRWREAMILGVNIWKLEWTMNKVESSLSGCG